MSQGWSVQAGWGSKGWDLGEWPYVAYYLRTTGGKFQLLQIVEGDHSLYEFDTKELRAAAIDGIFERGNSFAYVQEEIAAGIITGDEWRGPYRG